MQQLEQFTLASFMLIGLVNGFQLALKGQWTSFLKFSLAVTAGAVFGALGYFDLPSVEVGLAVGLSSSGIYKLVEKLGNKS